MNKETPSKSESGTIDTRSREIPKFSERSRSSYAQAPQKGVNGRPLTFWILLTCVAIVAVALAGHLLIIAPLEQSLLKEQARSLAKDLDGLVSARSAAVRVAAGNLDIDNLSAAGGLDRLLNGLRSLFPDFSNIELLNDRGQTLAMLGDLNLSLAGAPKSAQVVIDSSTPENKFLFRDDPANQSFLIVMQHGDVDSGRWFSRTRFSRAPIDTVLSAVGPERSCKLIMGESPNKAPAENEPNVEDSRSLSSAQSSDLAHTRWWNPRKAAEASLLIPGWSLALETVPGWTDYCPLASIPGLALLLAALYHFRRRDPEQRDDFLYSPRRLAPSIEPEWEDLSEFSSAVRTKSTDPQETAPNEFSYSPGHPETISCVSGYSGSTDSAAQEGATLGELLPEFFFEPAQDTAASPPMTGEDMLNSSSRSETTLDELPETLEVTWSEPSGNKTKIDSSEPEYVADSKLLSA